LIWPCSTRLRSNALLAWFVVVMPWIIPHPKLHAAEMANPRIEGAVYYDADEVDINQRDNEITLRGNVLFLFGDSFVRCQRLRYHRPSGIATLEGQVTIFRGKERIRAERIVVHVPSREFYAESIWLMVDPAAKTSDADFNAEVLGFSEAELTFEAMRTQRESDLSSELLALRDRYVSRSNLLAIERDAVRRAEIQAQISETKRRYAQILGRFMRTRHQPNLYLEALSASERSKLEKRREAVKDFVQANQSTAKRLVERQQYPGYLALTAKDVHQRTDGTLTARSAQLTPCRCDADDIAIWGLSTSDALIEPGRYATLYGASVDIASVPVAYIPYIKFPIKSERESGFLLPTVYATRAGQIVSVPYFQTLGDHADATVTIDDFSSRGTRVGAELRAVVSNSMRATVSGEYLEDPKRKKQLDPTVLRDAIDKQGAADPLRTRQLKSEVATRQLKSQVGTPRTERWKTAGALNIPYQNLMSAKIDWTLVSDNQYLSDFSVDKESKNDLFAPAQSSFRFLSQEASAEYYGERFGLGVRVQRLQDVLEPKPMDTPYRSPKIEGTLFPWRILQSSVFFDQEVSWENVVRGNDLVFLDQYTSVDLQTGAPPPRNRRAVLTTDPDGTRSPNEPFVVGQRFWSQSRLSTPLVANAYLLSTGIVRGVTTAYQFERTEPYDKQTPRMSYMAFELKNRSTMEFERTLGSNSQDETFFALSNWSPFLDFSYIPRVNRDPNFPAYYDVFYQADNITPRQTAFFGFEGQLKLGREAFVEQWKPLQRFGSRPAPPPGDPKALARALQDAGMAQPDSPSGQALFDATRNLDFSQVLTEWADLELSGYASFVQEQEFGATNQWPEPPFFTASRKLESTPLSYSVKTSYSLDVLSAERDQLGRLRPGDTIEPLDEWGDVVFGLASDGRPWLPLVASTSLTWSPLRKMFYSGSSQVTLLFPFNLSVGLVNTFENYESATGSVTNPVVRNIKRTIGINANYTPKKWLRLTYQRKTETDSQITSLPRPELRYESLQKISFLKLQDCLDIELSRYKKAAVIERNATWAIGINLHFLGESRTFDNLGDALNRSVQAREAEF
jgi:LPS-assembly protein